MKLVFTYLLLLTSIFSFSQAGSPVSSFGTSGKVITTIGTARDKAHAMAVQNDGKIIIAGFSDNSSNADFAVARYNTDGTLDNTFGSSGKVTTGIGASSNEYARTVAIQSDGKIVVAGFIIAASNNYDFALARYNTDGSLDATFDGDGKVTTNFALASSAYDEVYSLAIQSDGKIVAGGYARTSSGGNDFALARYNTDGSLDATFDGDGKVTTPIFELDAIQSIILQSDGKIVAGGYTRSSSLTGGYYDFALVRYNTNGSLDATFDGDGKVTTPIGSLDDQITSIAIQTDGKIVAGGNSNNGTNNDFALARYNTDGSLDATFDGDGKVTTAIVANANVIQAIGLQTDGKILAGGYSNNGTNDDFALARYNASGSLDATFDSDGKVIMEFGGSEYGFGMKLDLSRIYIAGVTSTDGTEDIALAAFQNDGTALPLTLTAFTATKQKGAVLLNWNTASETTTSHFLVERSADGSNFSAIATLQAAGNSTTTRQYTFTDTRTIDKVVYYRLRMVDLDGKYTYSKTIRIKGSLEAKALQVFPNPARGVLQVQTSLSGALTLSLYNAGGSVVRQVQLTSNSPFATLPLDVSSLPKGVYRLNVQKGKSSEVISFIKE